MPGRHTPLGNILELHVPKTHLGSVGLGGKHSFHCLNPGFIQA